MKQDIVTFSMLLVRHGYKNMKEGKKILNVLLFSESPKKKTKRQSLSAAFKYSFIL